MNVGNMTVKAKLTLAFGGLAFLILLASGLSIRALNEANQDFEAYVNGINARALVAAKVHAAVDARAIAARNLVLVTKPADMEVEKVAVTKAHQDVKKYLDTLKSMVAEPGIPANVKALVAEIDKVEQAYGPVALAIVGLALDGKHDAAVAKMNAECRPLLAALVAKADEYADVTAVRAKSAVAESHAHYAQQRNLLIAACLVAFAAAAVAGVLITRGLTRALGAEPGDLGHAAQRVASGDLSPVVGVAHAPKGSVLSSLGAMQQSLVTIVSQVRGASDSIATGSSEIAMGNADLSQRTEEQASALQQTAATMEEFTSTVRNNADNAQAASQLASTASQVASKGGDVVAQVVDTMKGINDSSKKIADITGVIDSIAFQTNILALNAAVEAARAGEQGRGFAVVAAEVRSLAGRSAEAAKEIKALIGDSVSKVNQGSALVDQAGNTMGEVVSAISRVTDVVSEISAASAQQSTGIDQIGQAVHQLDQTTQQNAALVEQSAAAAQSLEHQVQQLVKAVAVFKLGANDAHMPHLPGVQPSPRLGRSVTRVAFNDGKPQLGLAA